MKNLRKVQFGLLAVLLAVGVVLGMSAFTKPVKASERVTYFYKYKLNTYTQAQIENPANYQREDNPCTTGQHVCGVALTTDNGALAQPNVDEFDEVKAELWASEQADAPTISEIKMRN